jgi:tRNA (guanine37-N1)-methyltransferase
MRTNCGALEPLRTRSRRPIHPSRVWHAILLVGFVSMWHLRRVVGWGCRGPLSQLERSLPHQRVLARESRRSSCSRAASQSTTAAATDFAAAPHYNGTWSAADDDAPPTRPLSQGANREESSPEGEDWRRSPSLNPTLVFPTVAIPPHLVHVLVRDPGLQPFLASALWSEMDHVQRRLRIVRDDVDSLQPSEGTDADSRVPPMSAKLLLLHPNVADDPTRHEEWERALEGVASKHCESTSAAIVAGPAVPIQLRPKDFTVGYVLSQLLPSHLGAPPTSFETVGHVAHLNLPEPIMPYRNLVGQVLLECLASSNIRTVICKTEAVAGPYRTYEFEVVAGDPSTVVQHAEHGVNLQFDVQRVYWSSRLSQERKRLVATFRPGQVVADAFCGVGALCLQAAKRGCVVIANDWNPDAINALRENAKRNRVKLASAQCGDAYEFLMDLGLDGEAMLPDHVVMNYPLEAPRFLGALRWWPTGRRKHDSQKGSGGPRLHVYTFARAEQNRCAEEVAVDAIASHLVVSTIPNTDGGDYCRGSELEEYGCKVHVHFVRDVAPGKKVFCVAFTATPKLLRYMQGDFS